MNDPAPSLELIIDDEHPWFDAIVGHNKAARSAVVKPPPELPPLIVGLAGVGQLYHLEYVVEMTWSRARAYMRTRWVPTGDPISSTEETPTKETGDTKK